MSPLWRNQLRIVLGTERLLLSAYRRGFSPELVREESIALQAKRGAPPWQAAIEALPRTLPPSLAERPEITVILSNHFVRYALLPANPALKAPDEWMALARHRLSGIYGEAANGWLIRIAETTPKGPRIVCAIDKALLEAIDDQFTGSGASLKSVQPFLMTAFNRLQPGLGHEPYWLVIEDAGCLTISLMRDGNWQAIRSRWVDERWQDSLAEILERKTAILALEAPCTQAIVCTQREFDARLHPSLQLRTLGYNQLALALS